MTEHMAVNENKVTMEYLCYDVTQEDMTSYLLYTEAKVRQKNLLNRVISRKAVRYKPPISTEVNGRVNLDISTIKAPKEINITVTKP